MTDLHSSQIRSLAEAANNITNPITEVKTVEEVETVEEAVVIDKNMNIKAMVAVLKDISDALMGKNVVTQRERLKAITQVLASKRGFVTEVANSISNPITEAPKATKADDQHGTAKRVDRITKFLKKYPDPSKLKAHHLDTFFNHPDYFGETDAASDAAMKKLPVQHRKQIRAMRKDYDDRNW
jgi:hypothetical protein